MSMFTLAISTMAITTMTDAHPLVCRFGALGDMVLLTPLLQQLYLRSGLPCDIVGVGGWNRSLFAEMPWLRDVYSIDSRSGALLVQPQSTRTGATATATTASFCLGLRDQRQIIPLAGARRNYARQQH
jgi:ADP-heptose:LPS heptosyltransferase